MEKAKIKNIIILILAVMNLFLLIIVLSNAADGAKSARLRNDAIVEVLSKRQITLGEGVELKDFAPTQYTLRRNLSNEQRMLEQLIGKTGVSNQGADIYTYDGISGFAQVHGSGAFRVDMPSGTITLGRNPVDAVISALEKMGITCTRDGAGVADTPESVTVEVFCAYKGRAVFNSSIVCTFTNGVLSTIEGKRPLDNVASKTSPETYPDIADILMNFLSLTDSARDVFTQITAIDPGYFAQSPHVGEYILRPVWRIATDVSVYYFDGLTGNSINIDD